MTTRQAIAYLRARLTRRGHVYLSTGCRHGDHDYCNAMTGLNGSKRPGRCKHCGALCVCGCHARDEPARTIANNPPTSKETP